jgi:hypothetical protein
MIAGWHAVRVFAGVEFAVTGEIEDAGFDVYCPEFTERRPRRYGHRDDTNEVTKPLFPGWFFLAHDPAFRSAPFERGRVRLQIFHQHLVSDAQLDAVRAIAELATTTARGVPIEPGVFAKVMHGIMKGDSGTVLQMRGQRALLNVVRNGQHRIVKLPIADLFGVSRAQLDSCEIPISGSGRVAN